jgi:acyl-CoA thioesterase FadM
MTVDYLRPARIDTELLLRAEVIQETDRGFVVSCTLNAAGKRCASATVTAVQVPDTWMTPNNNKKNS